jgi:hypothetical protein
MPGDHVERGVADLGDVEAAAPLHGQPRGLLLVLERRHRGLEVARVGQAIGADRPAVGECELGTVVLAYVAARRAVDQLDLELDTARHDADLAGLDLDPAELGEEAQPTLLRHHQQLAVGIIEVVVRHRLGGEVDVRGHAGLGVDVARGRHRAQAREERELLLRDRHRAPAQLPDRAIVLAKAWRRLPVRQRRLGKARGVFHGRTDAVEPGALVGAARCRERRARQLLGVETVGGALRRVLSGGQGAGQRLRLEVVAEARHVAGRRRLRPLGGVALRHLAAICHVTVSRFAPPAPQPCMPP